MKKYIQIFVVFVLVLTVIGIARNSPAWASEQSSSAARPLAEIDVTESGSYTVGGLCVFNAVYKGSGASAKVAVDIPAEESRKVPFLYEGQLYLAGCHIVHSVLGVITPEMSPAYGSWEVCFGDRPDEQFTIYYYPDNHTSNWQPLVTTVKDGFACAPAIYTGVYAPAGKRLTVVPTPGTGVGSGDQQVGSPGGTVRPPSPIDTGRITESGAYNIGGVCSIIIEYHVPKLSNVIHVEEDTSISANVPFPDNEGLLYLPGCHVFHYKANILKTDMNVTMDEGKWKICFAAIPNKETTIYYYYANDDTPQSVKSAWTPLETNIENGMACAPGVDHTGVYAPVGK